MQIVFVLQGVTTQMKALDEYILMVLFVLLLKRVHFIENVHSPLQIVMTDLFYDGIIY